MPKIILKTLLLSILIYTLQSNFIYATKNAPMENWRSFVINLYFDGNNLTFDTGFPSPIETTITTPQKIIPGDIKIQILSTNKKILFETKYQPQAGSGILYIPYYLNASQIKIINPNQKIDTANVNEFTGCNENNICEQGEENLCPLDCKSANNPDYPLTPKENISEPNIPAPINIPKPLDRPIATFTPETAKIQMQNYLTALGVGILFLLIIFSIMYFKRK